MPDERCRAAGEEQHPERGEKGDDRRDQRADAEVLLELRVPSLEREVDRGEEGEEDEGEEADRPREGGEPGGDEALDERARGCLSERSRGDRAHGHPEQHGGRDARDRERAPPPLLGHVVVPAVGAEGERGAAPHDPDQHERERDVQLDGEECEGGREAREEEHDHQDQPDVVRLPDGPDRVGDEVPLRVAPRPARQEIPHSASEIGAAQQDVRGEGDGDDRRQDVRQRDELAHVLTSSGSALWATSRDSRNTTIAPRTR